MTYPSPVLQKVCQSKSLTGSNIIIVLTFLMAPSLTLFVSGMEAGPNMAQRETLQFQMVGNRATKAISAGYKTLIRQQVSNFNSFFGRVDETWL